MSEEKIVNKIDPNSTLEILFPDATFIGWASVQADGKVDISKIEETPIYASVPVFLPKDQMGRYRQFNEEKNASDEKKT